MTRICPTCHKPEIRKHRHGQRDPLEASYAELQREAYAAWLRSIHTDAVGQEKDRQKVS